MYVLIAGGGKVGANLARLLLRAEHHVVEDADAAQHLRDLEGPDKSPSRDRMSRPSEDRIAVERDAAPVGPVEA